MLEPGVVTRGDATSKPRRTAVTRSSIKTFRWQKAAFANMHGLVGVDGYAPALFGDYHLIQMIEKTRRKLLNRFTIIFCPLCDGFATLPEYIDSAKRT